MDNTNFNPLQSVKRRFFAMRNGIVADSLRKAGSPFRMIFGLNLPQIKDIAAEIGINPPLAQQLRDDVNTRESQLLAPMLLDSREISLEAFDKLINDISDFEVADIYCKLLIAGKPFSSEFINQAMSDGNDIRRYIALRLVNACVDSEPDFAIDVASHEINSEIPALRNLARVIIDNAMFWKETDEDNLSQDSDCQI